jgi:hypothetical protein
VQRQRLKITIPAVQTKPEQYKLVVGKPMRKQIASPQPKTIMLPALINPAQSEMMVEIATTVNAK